MGRSSKRGAVFIFEGATERSGSCSHCGLNTTRAIYLTLKDDVECDGVRACYPELAMRVSRNMSSSGISLFNVQHMTVFI